jgi:hypothetical protein
MEGVMQFLYLGMHINKNKDVTVVSDMEDATIDRDPKKQPVTPKKFLNNTTHKRREANQTKKKSKK